VTAAERRLLTRLLSSTLPLMEHRERWRAGPYYAVGSLLGRIMLREPYFRPVVRVAEACIARGWLVRGRRYDARGQRAEGYWLTARGRRALWDATELTQAR